MILLILFKSDLKPALYLFVLVQLLQWNGISNIGGFVGVFFPKNFTEHYISLSNYWAAFY